MAVSYINDEFFSRLETLALNLRKDLAGFFGGKHLVKTYGQTVEFADYREYQLGDDIRRIDWNLYSRFEKYFLKLFTDERQMHTEIYLDCSASMGKMDPVKGAYSKAFAAALGYLSVHNMDKISLKLVTENGVQDNTGVIVGKRAFFRAITELENVQFSGDPDIGKAVSGSPDTGTNDGLTIIISDFLSEETWKKAIDFLAYKRRQILLVQVMTPDEIDPAYTGRVNLIDSESVDMSDVKNMKIKITRSMQLAYAEAMADLKENIRSFCVSRGADYITIRTDMPIEKAIFGELLKVGIIE